MQKFDLKAVSEGFKAAVASKGLHRALLGVAVMLVISVLYFSTSFGEVLQQNDIMQGVANGQEAKEFYEATGEKTNWTNSLFSGMPTFQISPSYSSTSMVKALQDVYSLWLPSPVNLLFIMMFGFYILMLAFGVRWYLALLGAIGYGFSSYFLIIIGAGHIWKFCVLAYIPPTIAGIVLCYRGRLLLGGALTAFFGMMQIVSNHVQMTYYFLFVVVAMMIAYAVEAYRKKEMKKWYKATATLVVAGILAVGANLTSLYNTYEYSKETTRGRTTELTPLNTAEGEESHNVNKNGINRDAVTAWSYGVDETLTLLVPNLKGGATVKPNDYSDEGGLAAASVVEIDGFDDLVANSSITGDPAQDESLRPQLREVCSQFRQYFGDQPMTNGPVYVGALIFALFLLGIMVVKGPMKWALLAVTVLALLLSWGHNFAPFNYWMIDNFPMYDKFRTPSSVLVVVEFTMPLLAVLAIEKMLSTENFFATYRRQLYIAFGVPMFLCLLLAIMPSVFGNGMSQAENAQMNELIMGTSGLEQAFYHRVAEVVKEARLMMVSADAWRSFFILAVGLAAVWLYLSGKLKAVPFCLILLAVVVFDLYTVDKRYLNADNFVKKSHTEAMTIQPSAADTEIMKDKSNYRVMLVGGLGLPDPSYFHKSIGGYHAAKLTRYNDLMERQIQPADRWLIQRIQQGDSLDLAAPQMNMINLLNTKYLIIGESFVENPEARGNAWFVDRISYVENPDAEMAAISKLGRTEAVADKKFESVLGKANAVMPGDTIYETSYKPNELAYKAVSKNGGLAVFSEIYFPWGWTATVDGKEVPVGRVDYMLRALQVPAGEHDIVFRFDPQSIHTTETVAYTSTTIIYLMLAAAFLLSIAALARRKENK